MPRNSSGTYTLPAGNPVVPDTLIETTWANPTMSDLGSSITDSLDRFGRGGMLAALRGVDGTAVAPAFSFSSETTLGVYRPASGTLALAVGGLAKFTLTAALLTIVPPTTFQGAVTFEAGATLTGPISIDILRNQLGANFLYGSVTPNWQMGGASANAAAFGMGRFAASTGGPELIFGHSRSASLGTQTVLLSGDELGQLSFFGSDGTAFREGARLTAFVDGTPGASDMPGRIELAVSPDGSATPVAALTLSNDKTATFAGPIIGQSTIAGQSTLTIDGASTLKTTAVIGSSVAIPANTRAYIDRLGGSVLPALTAGTVLTLAGSSAASSPAILQLISGNTATASIAFGDTDAATRGAVTYDHSSELLALVAGAATGATLDGSGVLTPTTALALANGTAAAPSLRFLNSATTGLYRQAADSIGFANAGSESWRMDANGRFAGNGAAQTTRVSTTNIIPQLQFSGTTSAPASAGVFLWSATGGSSGQFMFARSKGAAVGTQSVVASGDMLGRITAAGSDGTQFTEAGRIQFVVDGTPGTNDMPGRIEFYTTPDGAATPGLALTLASDNAATFTGAIAGTTAAFTTSGVPTQVVINRTGSTVNSEIGFQTTSGTVFVGQGAANTFAVGSSNALNSTNWLNIASTGMNVNVDVGITGGITNTAAARFNNAVYGFLGIREGGAYGGAGPNTSADSLVIESNGNGGLSILTPNTSSATIYFGDPEANAQGRLTYTHSTDTLTIHAGNVAVLSLTDSAIALASGIDGILADVGPSSILSMGFRGLPQNSKSAAYTLVLTDAGKHIYHPSADTTARTWTIPANASVAFPIGTAVTFVNDNAAGTLTIAITTDTLVLAPSGATGSRTLAANGIATAVKVTATRWQISGTNLS